MIDECDIALLGKEKDAALRNVIDRSSQAVADAHPFGGT